MHFEHYTTQLLAHVPTDIVGLDLALEFGTSVLDELIELADQLHARSSTLSDAEFDTQINILRRHRARNSELMARVHAQIDLLCARHALAKLHPALGQLV